MMSTFVNNSMFVNN